MRVESKATFLATATSLGALAIAFGLALLLRSPARADSRQTPRTKADLRDAALTARPDLAKGRSRFERNCADCHGDDARGDEGPNLHDLRLSDERIARRIKEGIK